MRKLMTFGIVLLLFGIFVTAGSIQGRYTDGYFCDGVYSDGVYCNGYRGWQETTQMFDNSYVIEADTLGGYSAAELITICSDDININNTTPSQTIVYQGGGGISSGTVSKYLYGDRKAINDIPVLVDYIDTKYATKTEIEQLHERLDLIQAQVHYYNGFDSLPIDVLTIGIRAKRTGETIKYDGYVCNPENCIKVE